MRREIHANSLVFKIVITVTIGLVFLAVSIGAINMTVSKRVFVDNFAMTQRRFGSDLECLKEIISQEKRRSQLYRIQRLG